MTKRVGVRKSPRPAAALTGVAETRKPIVAHDVVRVHDEAGRLLFEHDPHTKRTVLSVPEGDLELRTENGSITLASARNVVVDAGERVAVRAARSVCLEHAGANGESRIDLDPAGVQVATPRVQAVAASAHVRVGTVSIVARTIETTVETARTIAALVEQTATRVVSRAKDVYSDIEGLAQTRAGRVRLVAEETLHLFGRRTVVRAREDVKVRAEKIHLG